MIFNENSYYANGANGSSVRTGSLITLYLFKNKRFNMC